jgi:hypothetical protein
MSERWASTRVKGVDIMLASRVSSRRLLRVEVRLLVDVPRLDTGPQAYRIIPLYGEKKKDGECTDMDSGESL